MAMGKKWIYCLRRSIHRRPWTWFVIGVTLFGMLIENEYAELQQSTLVITKNIQSNLEDESDTHVRHAESLPEIEISKTYTVREVPNDVKGKWRVVCIDEDIEPPQFIFDYYKTYFDGDDEMHVIINYYHDTTTQIEVYGNMIVAGIYKRVDGEEHDANKLFSGKFLTEILMSKNTGQTVDIEKLVYGYENAAWP